jgi:hypothetical protein
VVINKRQEEKSKYNQSSIIGLFHTDSNVPGLLRATEVVNLEEMLAGLEPP